MNIYFWSKSNIDAIPFPNMDAKVAPPAMLSTMKFLQFADENWLWCNSEHVRYSIAQHRNLTPF